MIPRLRCARCRAVFRETESARAGPGAGAVVCPECGHAGPPGGVMRPSPPPDEASFRRSVAAALAGAVPGAGGADGDAD